MKQLFRQCNSWFVLTFFFDNPYESVYLRELARKIKISASTVFRSLHALEKDGLVVVTRKKNGSFYKANLTPEFKSLKIAYSISKISNTKIVNLVKQKTNGLHSFLLFGSAAKGEDNANSDFDFVLISANTEVAASDLSVKLDRDVNLKKFTISEWKKAREDNKAFYLDVLSNSICLIGEKPLL